MEIILTLIVFVALLYLLYRMQSKYVKYAYRVFAGLGIGIVFGAIIQLIFGSDSSTTQAVVEWLDIVGLGYVRLLQMLVMPLIFVSLVRAFTEMEGESNLGKIGGNVLTILVVTVSIASAVGIASVLLFNLDGAEFTRGAAENARIAGLQESATQVENYSIPEQVLNFIPTNIFNDLSGNRDNSTIAVVIFSALVGIAYLGVARKQPEHAKTFRSIIDSLHAIVMRLVTLVLRIAPYGILALMTKMVATSSIAALANMGSFLVASYFAITVMFIIHGIILLVNGISPIQYVKKAWNVLSFALTIFRMAHQLYKMEVPILPRMMTEYGHSITGIDIHPGATIGSHFFIDHGTGVVIGETAKIGHHVKIYQGVTIGAKSFKTDAHGNIIKGTKRHPNIGNNVVIYAGATILGGKTKIGDNCIIGGNVWLTRSVEPNQSIITANNEVSQREIVE